MLGHTSVLLKEVIGFFPRKAKAIYVDGTFGAGGHTRALLERTSDSRVYAIDRDQNAFTATQPLLEKFKGRLFPIHGDFGNMRYLLQQHGVTHVDGILLDVGVSSMQLDSADRGFSFRKDRVGPLDMRMDNNLKRTAADVLNHSPESTIADILYYYGEEKHSRALARRICEQRRTQPFVSTDQLVSLIHSMYPPKKSDIDPATRTFQALRIYINDELKQLLSALVAAEQVLSKPNGGRLAVICFHSLEDRITKRFFEITSRKHKAGIFLEKKTGFTTSSLLPTPPASFEIITKHPVEATEEEIQLNPRARSAKLRVAERTAAAPMFSSAEEAMQIFDRLKYLKHIEL